MGRICVVSLGWGENDLTLGAVKRLRAARKIILKTGRCGAADWLCVEQDEPSGGLDAFECARLSAKFLRKAF